MSTQVTFRIHNVRCVDETGGGFAERVGNDEIFLGGFGIDGNGQTVKAGQSEIYAHFDDGDVKNFGPARRFVTLGLPSGGGSVTAGLLLVEKDSGGMDTALEKLYAKVVEEINKKRQEEMAQRRVASLAGLDIDWKAVWGQVKPLIVAYVKDKIVSAFNDDPFPLQSVSISVGPNGDFGNGSRTSPPATIEFRGHDGVYRLTYDWEVS
ncbi:MAG: hypothetical protein H7145_10465 [Akkermansiaceae bacterium]|nr:hypothetical protein [Armatimonadota bacterium]